MVDDETLVRQRLLHLRTGAPGRPAEEVHAVGSPLRRLPAAPSEAAPGATADLAGSTAELADRTGVLADSRTDFPESAGRRLAGPGPFDPLPGPFDPGRRGVKALAVVAVVAILGAALVAWFSRPRAEPIAADVGVVDSGPGGGVAGQADGAAGSGTGPGAGGPGGPAPGAGGGTAPAGGSGGTAPGAAGGELVVAVAGKVRRPGLVRLAPGARVADALTAAGGAEPGVDVGMLNLARRVTDGELILVGVSAPPGLGAAVGAVPPGATAGAVPGTPVNLNTASLTELDALPGVGPVLAQRILDHRQTHGVFRSVSDLRQVDGIGDARYAQLKDLVTV